MNFRYESPKYIDGWVKYLANSNATLVEYFGTIEAVDEEIRKIKRGKGEGGKLIDIQKKMDASDDRVEVKELLKNIQADLPALEELLARCSEGWGYEDSIYRFYHPSFKVYALQKETSEIVEKLQALAPDRPLDDGFTHIVGEGTGKKWKEEDNKNWLAVTRPIVEAFFHARYFLEMAVKYGKELKTPKRTLPSGWAALLYLYNLR